MRFYQEVVTEEEASLSAALDEVSVTDEGEEVVQDRWRLSKKQRNLVWPHLLPSRCCFAV